MPHKDPEQRKRWRRGWDAKNKDKRKAQRDRHYARHREELLEKTKQRRGRDREAHNAHIRRRYAENPSVRARRYECHVVRAVKTKAEIIDRYGGKCACCGEEALQFLALDHVDGGGNLHRKKMGGTSLYSLIKKSGHPDGIEIQVLCHNCNMARAHYGYCPHRPDVEAKGPIADRKRKAYKREFMAFKRPVHIGIA